jgi:DNA-binding response OmpR family regulator
MLSEVFDVAVQVGQADDHQTVVLVAAADAHARACLADALRSAHCRVLLASDGEGALELARDERPEVVFLDADLPGQNGWLVCAKLKVRRESPLVAMMVDRFAIEKTVDAGRPDRFAEFVQADEVLKKPFEVGEAVRVVRERLAAVAG